MKKEIILIYHFLKRKRLLQIGAIFLLGLIPLLWFKRGYLIGGVDFDFPLYPIREFFLRKFTWSNVFLGGADRSMAISGGITFVGLQAILKYIGLSLHSLQRVYLVFWYMLTGFSMYFCMNQLVRGKDLKSYIIRFLGTFFYMINFYQLHMWMIAREGELSGAIIIPVTVGLIIKHFYSKVPIDKTIGVYALFCLLSVGIGVQPPIWGVFLFGLFSCFLFYFFTSLQTINKGYIINRLLFLLLIFFSINLFWILPNFNYIIKSVYTATSHSLDVFNIRGLLEATSRYNSFLNVFRLYGDNVWFDGFKGRLYLPFFANYLNNPFLILSSFIFPILAFSAILISRKKHVIFFTLIALITLFLSKGIHPPFGGMFLWMINNIPGFWVYRAPWQKFTLITILSYSYLAAITCGYLYEKIPDVIRLSRFKIRHSKVIFLVLLISIHLVYHYGFIFGRFLPTTEERQVLPGFHQKYPDYLFDSAEWINSKEDQFKMILLPDDKANVYYWGYGGAQDISAGLFTKGLIFRQYGEGMAPPTSLDRVYNVFIDSLYKEKTPYAGKIAGLLNVRYFLHRNDFIYDWSNDDDSPKFIKDKLRKQKGITLEKSIGKWDFYKNKYELPHIYIPDNIIYAKGGLDTLPKLTYRKDFGAKTAVLFSAKAKKNEEITKFKKVRAAENSVEIEVNRVNPTKYIIRARNAIKPFFIVFNEKYKSDWKIFKIDNKRRSNLMINFPKEIELVFSDIKYLFKDPLISSNNHYTANGWANGWYVEPTDYKLNQDFSICLYYIPQSLFYLGLVVSVVSIITFFSISIIGILKGRKE